MKQHSVLIGTSPPMMMKAIELAQQGDRVSIFDQADSLGGAWATPSLVGLRQVEAGAHLLENSEPLYSRLRSLGVRMVPEQNTHARWGTAHLPMAPARVFLHAGIAAKAVLSGRRSAFLRAAKSAILSARYLRARYKYPMTGCREINLRLKSELSRLGVRPQLRVFVTRIAINTEGVICETSKGPVSADRIVFASRAHTPISYHGKVLEFTTEKVRTFSVVIRGRDKERKRVGYIEFFGDPMIKRIRDVSAFSQPELPENEFILVAQLRKAGEREFVQDGGEGLFARLAHRRIVSSTARVTHVDPFPYEYQTVSDTDLRRLERIVGPRLLTLSTTDFAHGFNAS